jgi:predicted component of type VI protein secretion system
MPILLSVYTYRNAAPAQALTRCFDRLGGAIGRAPGNDLVLGDPGKYISRLHARIEYRDEAYWLIDVGGNPSLVNDRPVGAGRSVQLEDGDRVTIGDYQLLASVESEATAFTPAAAPAPAQASRAPGTAAVHDPVVQALLRGLGLPELNTKRSAEEIAEMAGAMLREATAGTMDVLMGRAMTKRESRLDMTMISAAANNPLKFFPDADSALTQMMGGAMPGYMPAPRAFATAFDDLKAHELAIMAGMRAALAGVLARFDPAAIEARLQVPTVMDKVLASNRKAKMWDRMVELYTQMAVEADSDFHRLFGEAFGQAYEEQVARLRQVRR